MKQPRVSPLLEGAEVGDDAAELRIRESGVGAFGRHGHARGVRGVSDVPALLDEVQQLVVREPLDERAGRQDFAQSGDAAGVRAVARGAHAIEHQPALLRAHGAGRIQVSVSAARQRKDGRHKREGGDTLQAREAAQQLSPQSQ